MIKKLVSGAVFGLLVASGPGTVASLVVATGLMAGVSTAEAQRIGTAKYRPPYGDPFPGLDFFGEVKVTDGGCTFNNNLACLGSMSFVSATLQFGAIPPNINDTPVAQQTINFTPAQFGQVVTIDRANLTDWSGIVSTPFRAVQGTIPLTYYDRADDGVPGANAWFSLVLVGNAAQVIWFRDDPGEPILSFLNGVPLSNPSTEYAQCFLKGPGDKRINNIFGREINRCGLSSWEFDLPGGSGGGAPLLDENGNLGITVVPEPEAYGMGLAGLGVIGLMSLISRRRSAKR